MLPTCPPPKAITYHDPLPREGPWLAPLGTHWFPAHLLGRGRGAPRRGGCSEGRGCRCDCQQAAGSADPAPRGKTAQASSLGDFRENFCTGSTEIESESKHIERKGQRHRGSTWDPLNPITAPGIGALRHWHPKSISTALQPEAEGAAATARASQESAAPSLPSPPDQSEPRALSRCSGERSRRGGHKGNKRSRITSECINYFQWLPCANPLPPSSPGRVFRGQPAEGATGRPRAALRAQAGTGSGGGEGGGASLRE